MLLGKNDILKADDLVFKDVEVPEWGGTVRVSVMSGVCRDRWETDLYVGREETNMENLRARLAALTIVNKSGNLIFTVEDIEALGKKSATALSRVFEAARSLNALTPAELEEMVKNSTPGHSEGSSSN